MPERPIVIVADNSFVALELLNATRRKVCVVTCLRLDAALFDPAPQRAPGTIGRPRRKGARYNTESHIEKAPHKTFTARRGDEDSTTVRRGAVTQLCIQGCRSDIPCWAIMYRNGIILRLFFEKRHAQKFRSAWVVPVALAGPVRGFECKP